jgi:ATP-dependent DNA helicase RecQ
MLVKVFTLRFDPRIEGFDDAPLREFMRDKETLSVRDHFFVRDEAPYWGVMVTYNVVSRDGDLPASRAAQPAPAAGKEDYRALLRAEDWPLFNALRDWRSQRAKAEGVPPYIVVTNDLLARVARERPASLAALGRIRGMGEAKIKRHGRDILAVLGHHGPPPASADAAAGSAGEGARAESPAGEEKEVGRAPLPADEASAPPPEGERHGRE